MPVRPALAALLAAGTTLAPAAAQSDCATVISPAEAAQLRLLDRSGIYNNPAAPDGPVRIGLAFHVVRRSDGTGGLPQSRLDQAIVDANTAFAPAGIQFCQHGPTHFINSDTYYDISGSEYNPLRMLNVVPGAINCYFVNSAGFCGISSFTTSSVQGIVYNNTCVGLPSNPSTFPHEIGHYFNLYHTHETAFGTECTTGSNCGSAGDLVCDTAADPNVLGVVSTACLWTGSASPPCGGGPAYNPPVRNLMSYSNKDCRDHYTPGQNSRALTTLLTLRPELRRDLCAPPCYPNCDASTTAPILNVNDFVCFQSKYGAGDPSANCDGSTIPPVLNINDFTCFITAYAAGCP